MKWISFSLVGIALFALFAFQQTAPKEQKKAQVMVLGTWHLNNPNQDLYNIKSDDITTPKRQKELDEVAAKLAAFKPTKIAVERLWQTKTDTIVQANYKAYLAGNHTLHKGEAEQIGFRLAKKLGHDQVYSIDHRGSLPFDAMMGYAQKNNQMDILQPLFKQIEAMIGDFQAKLEKRTIAESLKDMNAPSTLDGAQSLYVSMVRIGKDKDYPGADVLTKWYERNIKIYANMTRVSADPEDRILIVFGSGHAAILRQLIRTSTEYELVEAVDYL